MILEHRPHPEQGFRSCLGIVRLAKAFGPRRLEAACERALHVGARSYATYADAILDRLVHNAHRLDLAGDSMRRAKSPKQD